MFYMYKLWFFLGGVRKIFNCEICRNHFTFYSRLKMFKNVLCRWIIYDDLEIGASGLVLANYNSNMASENEEKLKKFTLKMVVLKLFLDQVSPWRLEEWWTFYIVLLLTPAQKELTRATDPYAMPIDRIFKFLGPLLGSSKFWALVI